MPGLQVRLIFYPKRIFRLCYSTHPISDEHDCISSFRRVLSSAFRSESHSFELTHNTMTSSSTHTNILAQPLKLPCGAVLKNRIAKSCMSDSLGNGEGLPTEAQVRLYERWADGGCAMACIGEVQGVPDFSEKMGNLVVPVWKSESKEGKGDRETQIWRKLASSTSRCFRVCLTLSALKLLKCYWF